MVFENELREQLLGEELPVSTKEQMLKKQITDDMVKSILPFLNLPGHLPFHPIPNSLHLKNMIELYENWRDLMDETSEMDRQFSSKISQYLLKIAHYWWTDIRPIVHKIIGYYVVYNKDCREIVYGVTVKTGTWKTIFKWESWLSPVSTNHTAADPDNTPLVYCLDHYDFKEMSMHEMNPVEQRTRVGRRISALEGCFCEARPEKLLVLLQYDVTNGRNVEELAHTCIRLLDDIISLAHLASVGTAMDDYFVSTCDDHWDKRISCGKILLRVTPQVIAYQELKAKCEDMIARAESIYFVNSLPGIIDLKFPFKLKRLCRLTVRVFVKDKYGLPHGIQKLPLPQDLKDYINLLLD